MKTSTAIPKARTAARDAAMPEVQRLVKQYGLTAANSCVTRLREKKRAQAEVDRARKELEALEAKL